MKETSQGTFVCTFSLMSIRAYKKNDDYEKEVSFFDVDVWGKLAEVCVKNTSKGRGVRVVGRLKQSRWVGEDGTNRAKITIVAEHVEFKPVFKKSTEELAHDAEADAIITNVTKQKGKVYSTSQANSIPKTKENSETESLAEDALVF